MWYEDASRAGPASGTLATTSSGAESVEVLDHNFHSFDPLQREESGNTHVVKGHALHGQFGQNHGHGDVAHPPMLTLTKLAGSRHDGEFDQVWDCNQDEPKFVFFAVEKDYASSDDDCDDARRPNKIRVRPSKGKRQRFRKYVDKMKLEIKKDPFGFKVDDTLLPLDIATTDKLRGRFTQILKAYQHEVLEGLADPNKESVTTLSILRVD